MYYIGIDLGGTNIAVGVVDDNCKIIDTVSAPTNASRTDREVITDMASLARDLADRSVGRENIAWIGIGTPGAIDRGRGVVLFAGNLPFEMTPMRDIMQEHWNIPVIIDNDANCAALGEVYAGGARGCRDALFITLGTGVGGGIIIDQRVYSGFNSNGGEVGHMGIVVDGELCTCGRHGCWEAYASVTGLIRMTREAMERHPDSLMWDGSDRETMKVSGKTAYVAAKAGDAAAKAVVDRYHEYVAFGITSLINIFQPEVLCIGGAISREGEYLLGPVRRLVGRDRFTRYCAQTELKIAELGNDAGIIGAAMLGK